MAHRKYLSLTLNVTLAFSLALVLQGCRSSDPPRPEKPVALVAPPKSEAADPVKLPAATAADVQAALKRVFNNDIHTSGAPEFMTADLNGDGVEDLAVVVHPASAKLGEINDELANWIVQDVDKFFVAPQRKSVVVIPEKAERAKIGDEDILAVIHGNGPMAWCSPDARQAYLLKHGAANYTQKVPSFKQKEVRALGFPVKTEVLLGRRNEQSGVLFWTGSAYGWHVAR